MAEQKNQSNDSEMTDVEAETAAEGLTPLHSAMLRGNFEMIREYFKRLPNDAFEFEENSTGLTLLHVACSSCDSSRVEYLLKFGPDVNAQATDDSPIVPGFTALHFMANLQIKDLESDVVRIVELLLKFGADVTLKNFDGKTPIHLAHSRYGEISGKLIDAMFTYYGDYQINPADDQGLSHFHIACLRNNVEAVRKFLEHGVDVNLMMTSCSAENRGGETALHLAAAGGYEEMVDVLVGSGADVDAKNGEGSTPLYLTLKRSPVNVNIVKKLLRSDENHLHTFLKAVADGSGQFEKDRYIRDVIELLLSHGALVNGYDAANKTGTLGLLFKVTLSSYRVFKEILKSAIDLATVDEKTGRNAIHNIVSIQSLECSKGRYVYAIKELMEYSCDVDLRDFEGKTPLQLAAECGNVAGIHGLLAHGADIFNDNNTTVFDSCDELAEDVKFEIALHMMKFGKSFSLDSSERQEFCIYLEEVTLKDPSKCKALTSTRSRHRYEVEKIKKIKIAQGWLTLFEFCNIDRLLTYSSMPLSDQQAIHAFFQKNCLVIEEFECLGGWIKYLYKEYIRKFLNEENVKNALESFDQGKAIDKAASKLLMYEKRRRQDYKGDIDRYEFEIYETSYKSADLIEVYSTFPSIVDCIEGFEKYVNYRIPDDYKVAKYRGYTPLHFAISTGNLSDVEKLLDLGADFTIKNSNGFTPLRLAMERSYSRKVNCFELRGIIKHPLADLILDEQVKTGNSTNPKCPDGISHFHIACILNHTTAVEFFLRNGTSVMETVGKDSSIAAGYTPLHFAARYCSVETMKILLSKKASRFLEDAARATPLHLLIDHALDMIDFVYNSVPTDSNAVFSKEMRKIRAGIDLLSSSIKDCALPFDHIGLTRLHVACTDQHNSLTEDFVKGINDFNIAIDLDSPNWPGYTPLHFAAICNFDSLIFLVKHGANVGAKNVDGVTPMDLCLGRYLPKKICRILDESLKGVEFSDNEINLAELLRSLYEKDLFEKYLTSKTDVKGLAVPLHSPVWRGYTISHLIAILINESNRYRSISKNTNECFQENYDHLCGSINEISKRHILWRPEGQHPLRAPLTLSVNYGCDPNVADPNGETAFQLACKAPYPSEFFKGLEESDVNLKVDAANFHLCVCTDSLKLAENALVHGVDVDEPVKCDFDDRFGRERFMKSGYTPLHMSACLRYQKMVSLLLQRGADPTIKNNDGLTPLHLAFIELLSNNSFYARIKSSKNDVLSVLFENPKILQENHASPNGLTNLHVACYFGHVKAVAAYLKHDVDVNLSMLDNGYTPMHFAVEKDRLAVIEMLLADRNFKYKENARGLTPLHLALKEIKYSESNSIVEGERKREFFKKETALDLLLRNSAARQPDYCDSLLFTSLHYACANLDVDLVESLLESKIDINCRTKEDSPIYPGSTPLHLLFELNRRLDPFLKLKSIVRLLLGHGADVSMKNSKNQSPIHVALSSDYGEILPFLFGSYDCHYVNPIDNEGLSFFHIACRVRDMKTVEKFLEYDVNVNQATSYSSKNHAGYTPLHFAVKYRSDEEVIRSLLRHKADVNARDAMGSTPLHIAMEHSLNAVKLIIRLGQADVNARNTLGETPLCLIGETLLRLLFCNKEIRCFYLAFIKLLLSCGARVNVTYRTNKNLLRTLFDISVNFPEVLDLLCEKAANKLTDLDDINGRNAFHYLVTGIDKSDSQYETIMRKLLIHGCDVVLPDRRGKTPLHLAAEHGDGEAICKLLSFGADINATDSDGKTALESFHPRSKVIEAMGFIVSHVIYRIKCGFPVLESNKCLLREKWRIKIGDEINSRENETKTNKPTISDLFQSQISEDYWNNNFWEKHGVNKMQIRGLYYMECRKAAKAKANLLQQAKKSMHALTGIDLTKACFRIVAKFLTIDDLKNLVKSSEAS